MIHIGEGLQFKVVDLGNGRVRKHPKKILEQLATIFRWKKFPEGILWIIMSRLRARGSIRESIRRVPADKARLIGNASECGDGTYEQDCVVTLSRYFRTRPLAENQRAVDGYIDNVLELARYGITRPIFNLAVDHGVYPDGFVCNLDLGEFEFKLEPMLQQICSKGWLKCHSYLEEIQDPVLRDYLAHQMEARLEPCGYAAVWEECL